MSNLKLRVRLTMNVSILIFATIVILTLISSIFLSRAYNQVLDATHEKLDQMIQSQVECMVGVLQTNYDRFKNGEISEEAALENAKYLVRSTRYSDGVGYFWADMADGINAVHINPDVEGTNRYQTQDEKGNYFVQDTIKAGDKAGGGFIDFYFTKPGESEAKAKRGYVMKFEPYGWYIGTGNYEEDMLPLIQNQLTASNQSRMISFFILIASGAVVLIVSILLISVVASKIAKPITKVSHRLQQLSIGNLQDEVEVRNTKDEVGILTSSLALTVESLRSYIKNISEVLADMEEGNLDIQINLEYQGDFEPIKNSLLSTVESLNHTFHNINQSADQVFLGAGQLSSGSQILAQGAVDQASSIEELVAVMNDISDHIHKNANHTKEADQKAQETAKELEVGKQQMQLMVSTMEQINNNSMKISNIIKTIEEIAFRTNILAINAAIEAGRAGEAGKSFVIVADQVRELAGKSSIAAQNTAELIEDSVLTVQEGSKIVDATAESLNRIMKVSEETADLVRFISAASREQADSISQVTQGIDQISDVVQNNSATAEQSAASSEELSSQAQLLKNMVDQFKLKL